MSDIPPADVLTILRARPDLKIVGVHATGNAVTVLSGRVYLAHTLTDVLGGDGGRLLPHLILRLGSVQVCRFAQPAL
ncbi:MAG: hypothetical protein U9R05_05100 [Chloroflexota bacterium]|nr:hypothetical protein [Chloroflexota bacterium]